MGESTIEATRFVKDAILRCPSIVDIPITRTMLDNVREPRNSYFADLEAKCEIDERENTMEKEAEDKQQVQVSLSLLQNTLVIADDSVKEENKELKELLTLKSCSRNQLQRAHWKIEMWKKMKLF